MPVSAGIRAERELLEPLRGQIPETVFTQPYTSQPNAGAGWSRENLLEAAGLLREAGWVVRDGQLVWPETGEPFHIRFVAVSPALGDFASQSASAALCRSRLSNRADSAPRDRSCNNGISSWRTRLRR